jgi:hypothetical protein
MMPDIEVIVHNLLAISVKTPVTISDVVFDEFTLFSKSNEALKPKTNSSLSFLNLVIADLAAFSSEFDAKLIARHKAAGISTTLQTTSTTPRILHMERFLL